MKNYRQIHKDQLEQSQPDRFRDLKRSGKLGAHLKSVQAEAESQFHLVVKQLKARNPYNPVEWKNSREAWEGWVERTADELVLDDLVLVKDKETEAADLNGTGYL